ncbi:MAG: hypothetical protein HYY43_05925 [Deltaproteobacteria bacterium]|nr:hypothetical protein [Deltaproteobacteria bacterium]MBI2975108.1 hypothetical protein [Deltaproteobacteria bacterium]
MKKIFMLLVCITLAAGILAFGCKGGGGGGDSGFGTSSTESGDCAGGGWCGDNEITVTANIGGAEAMFIASENTAVVGDISAEKAITVSSESPLFSVTTSGVVSVLAAAYEDGSDALSGLPRLSFVAVSPLGHVILVFEHSFMFTEPDADYSDPWAESSPYTCQIFVVDRKLTDVAAGAASPGLTCLTTELVLNTWDSRAAMVQFDDAGGVYFTAHVPQNWKNVLLKWTPGTDDASTSSVDESTNGTLAEMINANICFREYLVTNEGGVLYTGITSTNGDCNGTSFLRFRTPAGALQEVTSGWWEYVFKPIEGTASGNIDLSPNITTSNIGQILFYGPDPEVATSPEWNDACLFKFNPDATGEARSIQIADCDIDIWQYVDWADNITTKKTRCTEQKSMMGGGNVPEKILLADLNGDGDNYEIYVLGDIYEKKAGEWRCDLCVNDKSANGIASYCVANNNLHFEATTAGACTAVDDDGDNVADGTWIATQTCYNQQVNSSSTGNICQTTSDDFDVNGQWCQQPGGDWRDTYSAFAWAIWSDANNTPTDDSDDTKQIVRFSDNNEIVRNGWIINNRIVYSAFNSDDGVYKLREVVWTDADADGNVDTTDGADDDTVPDEITKTDLLTGIEVYELFADPRSNHSGEWFFNGLRFSDNQYITGTFNPDDADPDSTLATEAGVTGQIETLVIVPSF